MYFGAIASGGIAAATLLVLVAPASAGFVDIGGGWAAQWDDTLDPFVNVTGLGVVGDAVFIEKAAEFTQGSEGGIFPSIPIVFRQIAENAVPYIVIDSETITNSTGEDWSGYVMNLLDHGEVAFDPVLTMQSGGGGPIGWDIAPFTTAQFENADMRLTIGGGIVADGQVWQPGAGPDGGDLWIAANPGGSGDPFTIFTLKETPTPSPAALGLAALAALSRRRRR